MSSPSNLSKTIVATMVVLTSLLSFLFITMEAKQETIKIGLVTTLTGPASTAGAQTRNGVILAIEQANSKGGINGRQIELVIKDDKASAEVGLEVDNELLDAGVVAILGHYISNVSIETTPLMNQNDVVMLALSSTTSELTGYDDNFMRIAPADDNRAPQMAELMSEKLNLKRISVVYDSSNARYTESFFHYFKTRLEALGGEISNVVPFDSNKEISFLEIINNVIDADPEGLLIIANAIDGAFICQHLRMKNSQIRVVDSGWAFTGPDFISNGGPSTNGVISLLAFDPESSSPMFMSIKEKYRNRFHEPLRLYGQRGYEAAQVVLFALSQTSEASKIKEVILKKGNFNSLNNTPIIFDEYGDVSRPLFILEMNNERMVTIGDIVTTNKKDTRI